MKKHYCLLCCMVLLSSSRLLAQGLVSVNNFTGTASVVVPMYTVTQGSISVPVTAVYNAGGLKVKDVEGNAGMGWNVSAGGGIYRTVRGLPDDMKEDSLLKIKKGWLYNADISNIAGFTIANTTVPLDCPGEMADIASINSNFNSIYDTEPDIYNVSAPGLTCQLVFDVSHNIHVIPYRDYKVTYHTDATTGNITDFSIINDQGTTYYFADLEKEKKVYAFAGGLYYYKKEYAQYHNGIVYNTAWKLSKITDINLNNIYFKYTQKNFSRNTPLGLAVGGSATVVNQYIVKENFYDKALVAIDNDDTHDNVTPLLAFYYTDLARVGNILSYITGFNSTKAFQYASVSTTGGSYVRQFLQTIAMGDETLNFTYNGITGTTIPLPDSTSKAIDYWGYYNNSSASSLIPQVYVNPSDTTMERYRNIYPGTHSSTFAYTITGADRNVDTAALKTGTMTRIDYTHGGFTDLFYESNSYYDPTAGANINGGGLRIKEVRDYNGTDTATVSVRGYSYLIPGTSTSSGKPVSLPMFEFTTPYVVQGSPLSDWTHATIRSEDDLSPEDNTIIYSAVKISQPALGRQLYEYSTPATFWDHNYSTDWQPTTVYDANPSCVTTFATSSSYAYNFPVNANYGFERGLLTKMTSYTGANDEVSESTYTYQRTGTPTIITGLKFGSNLTDTVYAKYNINTNVSELTATVTNKVYNLNSTSLYQTNTVDYYYTSAYHKLLTQQKTTNSDGTINRTNYKYVKDYVTTGTLDSASEAIYNLQQLNANIPVETYAQVERGGTNRTVGAALTEFNKFDFDTHGVRYLPQHKLKFVSGAGVTDFAVSTITSGVFTPDTRYIRMENDLLYNFWGDLQTANDNNHHISTVFTDQLYRLPMATVSNASANEVAFGHQVTLTIDKNPLAAYYIYAGKMAATTTGGTLTAVMSSGGHTHSYSIAYPASSTTQYLRLQLPLTDMGAQFTVYFYGYASPVTGDITYPNIAQVNTYTYDYINRLKTSETNTNGKTTYYDYGVFNRPSHVYDNDHNMLQTTSYVTRNGSSTNDMGMGSITCSAAAMFGFKVFLSGGFSKMVNTSGAVYHWDFGDGNETETMAEMGSIQHSYASADSFTVRLTVRSPYYPTKTYTQKVSSNPGGGGGGGPGEIRLYADSLANGSGAVTNLAFFDTSGHLLYSFSKSQIAYGLMKILQQFYNVSVTVEGQAYDDSTGLGFNSVGMHLNGSGAASACDAYVGKGRSYWFSVDLTGASSVAFIPNIFTCTP